jgi:nitroreductase
MLNTLNLDGEAMNTFDAIRERRAVKQFDPHHQFTKQETEQLLDLAMQAPSSFNIQHWRLVNVTDKALRLKLREVAYDQAQVTDGSLLFVVTVDIKAWEKDPGSMHLKKLKIFLFPGLIRFMPERSSFSVMKRCVLLESCYKL